MMTIYDLVGGVLTAQPAGTAISAATIWVDLREPTRDEGELVEAVLAISIPTRAEMREIEPSNRLYQENGAHYMTAQVVYNIEQSRPDGSQFTFILAGNRLVTVRHAEPKSFKIFLARAVNGDLPSGTGAAVLVGLIEAIINRQADLIERIQDEVERLMGQIFDIRGGTHTRNRRLEVTLLAIGKEGDLAGRAHEAAFSLDRLLHFFAQAARERNDDARTRQRIEVAHRDITTLREHAQFLGERVTFMLDASLGMINTEQNKIIKLFSVVAVMLMPPTLIASIYGMNFRHMPELGWEWGYPAALGLMLMSAVLPYLLFRSRGWL